MYRPAGAENEVGGDFYDAFRVAGGWMLVIGDVTGRGAQAASITALARYTLRTAAVLTDDPLVALATLNRALLARGGAALCSIAALELERGSAAAGAHRGRRSPAAAACRWRAGRRGRRQRSGAGRLSRRRLADRPLPGLEPGQQLVMVTDGITEAVGEGGRFGEAAAAHPSWPALGTRPRRCSGLKARCTRSPPALSRTTRRFSPSPAPADGAGLETDLSMVEMTASADG